MTAKPEVRNCQTGPKPLTMQESASGMAGVEGLEPPTPGFGERAGVFRRVSLRAVEAVFASNFQGCQSVKCLQMPPCIFEFGPNIGPNFLARLSQTMRRGRRDGEENGGPSHRLRG